MRQSSAKVTRATVGADSRTCAGCTAPAFGHHGGEMPLRLPALTGNAHFGLRRPARRVTSEQTRARRPPQPAFPRAPCPLLLSLSPSRFLSERRRFGPATTPSSSGCGDRHGGGSLNVSGSEAPCGGQRRRRGPPVAGQVMSTACARRPAVRPPRTDGPAPTGPWKGRARGEAAPLQ